MTFKQGVTPPGAKPFPKGASGNPAGRPKGARSTRTILRELLDLTKEVKADDGTIVEVARHEFILAKLVNMAEQGDMASIDRVFDRLDCKAVSQVELANREGEIFKTDTTLNVAELPDALVQGVADLMDKLKGT